jgi:hypothetical protein
MNTLSNRELVNRAYVYNTASPASDANILTTSLGPLGSAHRYLRIYACFSVAGKLTARVTVGAATVVETLNNDTNLTAGASYLFDIPIHTGETINFRYSAGSGTTYRFVVDEYSG